MRDHHCSTTPGSREVFRWLAPRLRVTDQVECLAKDISPEAAMRHGYEDGPSYTCWSQGEPIGALGWTHAGVIWSLWRPLTRGQTRSILAQTPGYVDQFVTESGRECLFNYVDLGNAAALGWLQASRCFAISTSSTPYRGRQFARFETLPEVIARV